MSDLVEVWAWHTAGSSAGASATTTRIAPVWVTVANPSAARMHRKKHRRTSTHWRMLIARHG